MFQRFLCLLGFHKPPTWEDGQVVEVDEPCTVCAHGR